MERPAFTIGIEEEYLLVDRDSRALGVAPEGFLEDCRADLQDQVSPEYKQCQVEIGTRVCPNDRRGARRSAPAALDDLASRRALRPRADRGGVSTRSRTGRQQQHDRQASAIARWRATSPGVAAATADLRLPRPRRHRGRGAARST